VPFRIKMQLAYRLIDISRDLLNHVRSPTLRDDRVNQLRESGHGLAIPKAAGGSEIPNWLGLRRAITNRGVSLLGSSARLFTKLLDQRLGGFNVNDLNPPALNRGKSVDELLKLLQRFLFTFVKLQNALRELKVAHAKILHRMTRESRDDLLGGRNFFFRFVNFIRHFRVPFSK